MAFAAVISLKNTIHRLKNLINFPQITKPAYDEELDSLISMLKKLDDESSRSIDRSAINELDTKIREAVWKLEDVLESYSLFQKVDEKGVEQEMDSFLKTVKMLRDEYNRVLQNPIIGEEDDAAVLPIQKSSTVGLRDQSEKIRERLLHGQSHIVYVSLFGMAGIGKTHLATDIYHHPLIVQHFDLRLWVSVGPKGQITNNVLVDIVAQIEGKPRDQFKEKCEFTLRDLIRKSLRTRRYLIVLDDIWSTQVLDYFSELLPDYGKRSRFLLTTRQEEVAKYRIMRNYIHPMPFLNNEESWSLLWQNVFVDEKSFPPQLEKPGRKIAQKCEGLPLLILAVANILRGLDKTEEYWEKVAEKKTTTFTDAYDQIYEVLLPSYEYLPQQLKPCFLYLGVFPQSFEIPFSKLIKLWAVEDFLEPTQLQNLEDFGMECLQDLVSKSLAIVCKWSFKRFSKRINSLKLHSAYWYLCVTEARKNKFFHVLNKLTDLSSIETQRRLSVQNNILLGIKEVYVLMAAATETTRSLLCTGENHQYPVRICFNMMLLIRVLDALAIRFYEFPTEVLKLVLLRYLSLTHNGKVPSSIYELQQLQCLILRPHHNVIKLVQRESICLPEEIWKMPELRHLRINGSNLSYPSHGAMLPKLLTLHMNADSCNEAVFRSIQNLKKLGITIHLEPDAAAETETVRCFEHIKLLNELESVKCVVVNPRLKSQLAVAPPDHLSNLPRGLRKLSLNGLGYPWKYMSVIGSLPFLKVLKLRCSAFQGPHWETKFGQFMWLEYLLLEDIDLVHWTSQRFLKINCFHSLRHLIVRHCYKLKEIPLEIGDKSHPEMIDIEVDDCSPSVVASARKIKDKLIINSSWA